MEIRSRVNLQGVPTSRLPRRGPFITNAKESTSPSLAAFALSIRQSTSGTDKSTSKIIREPN